MSQQSNNKQLSVQAIQQRIDEIRIPIINVYRFMNVHQYGCIIILLYGNMEKQK